MKHQINGACRRRTISKGTFINKRSCRLLKTTTDHTAEHINANTLALDFTAGLIFLVGRDKNNGALNLPTANILNKLLQSLTATQIKPPLQRLRRDGTESLSALDGNADADQLLEAGDVGGQIGVQVIRVQG